jgi:hypothetical protein
MHSLYIKMFPELILAHAEIFYYVPDTRLVDPDSCMN